VRRQRNFVGPAAMGGMVGLWGANSLIKSVQRGTLGLGGASSASVTVSAVAPENSVLRYLGSTSDFAGANASAASARIELASATSITAYNPGGTTVYVTWELLEYLPGIVKSVQRGTLADAATGAAAVTINAVNLAKTALHFLGFTTNVADTRTNPRMSMNDATTVVIWVGGAGVGTNNCGYQVVEYY